MIINFSIENFGSIKERQTLSFEAEKSDHLEEAYVIKESGYRLLKLALIYGPNASGKTNVLKALEFLGKLVSNPAETKTEVLSFEPFLFDRETPNQNTVLALEFIQNGTGYSYEVIFNKKAIVGEKLLYLKRNVKIFERTTDLEDQFTRISLGSGIKVDNAHIQTLQANTIWNSTVLGGYLKTNIEFKQLQEVTDWFENYLQPTVYSNSELEAYVAKEIYSGSFQKADIVQILQKADIHISDIRIDKKFEPTTDQFYEFLKRMDVNRNNRITKSFGKSSLKTLKIDFVHTVNEEDYLLSFGQESQGTQRYYGFAGLLTLLIRRPCIIPIDELEASLHPELFRHFLFSFLMNTEKSQIVATTHNREILNDKDTFRNEAIWFTEKNSDQATELYSLADFDSSVVRNTSNILNAYKSGKLGATPNFQDYYIELSE